MTVTHCGWCLRPNHPNALYHPGGQAEHRRIPEPEVAQMAEMLDAWAGIAYDMWALIGNSGAIEDNHEWEKARDRLRNRFHELIGAKMGDEKAEMAQYSKPVLKQTEVQQECQTCFVTVPQSSIDKHLAWHMDSGHDLKTTKVGE